MRLDQKHTRCNTLCYNRFLVNTVDLMPLASYLDTFPVAGQHVFMHASAQIIAVLRGDVNRIRIGRGSNIQDLAMCHVSHKSAAKPDGSPLLIGDYVTVGHSVILHGCAIGNECLIGMGSIVMDDVIIHDRVMLGAGSLVPPGKILESGMLYVGRPAVPVRALTPEEIDYLRYSAEHYVRVKSNYLKTQRE
jgi:carbonic anhydrase/acetyltransferase-like protein (isoleucine patch superfamily)